MRGYSICNASFCKGPPSRLSQSVPTIGAQYGAVRAAAISNYGPINYEPIHETRAHREKGRLGVTQ